VRLLGLDITRRNATATAPPRGEYGTDREWWAAQYEAGGPDINPVLSGQAKYDVYDEMALTDSVVKSLLWMQRLPIRGATWELDPASEDGQDLLVRDVVARNLGVGDWEGDGHLAAPWPRQLDQALLALRWGSMLEELVWDDPVRWDFDGTSRLVRPLARLAPRPPRTVRKIEFDQGRIRRVEQNLSQTRPIPGDKLAFTVLDEEPGRWEGVSLLRAAWGPWALKKQLMIAAGIAWDRWAAGIPVVRYPTNGSAADLEKAEEIGRSIRTHERAYVAFEGPEPTPDNPNGWSLQIEGGASVLPDPVNLLQRYDLYVLAAGLQQFMALGSTQSGSRAVAEVQDEPFYMAVEAIAGDLAAQRQQQVIRRIVDVNFGTEYEAPKLRVAKIQSEDVEKLARILADLQQAGFTFSDRDVQNYVRGLNRLPELPEAPLPPETVVQPEGGGLPPAPPDQGAAAA